MAGYPVPTSPGGFVADKPGQVGGAARGWLGLRRLLADRWGGEEASEVVRLWAGAMNAEDQPVAVRVRAATALDPFLR